MNVSLVSFRNEATTELLYDVYEAANQIWNPPNILQSAGRIPKIFSRNEESEPQKGDVSSDIQNVAINIRSLKIMTASTDRLHFSQKVPPREPKLPFFRGVVQEFTWQKKLENP